MEALGINLPGLVTQIVSFVILLAVLSRLLYRPVLTALDQRSDRIRESLETAQRAKEEAELSREEMRGQIQAARTEGQAMIAQAREAAERFREEELAKARKEVEAERARAQANIQSERDAAIEELRSEFAGLAISAAELVVERSIDESAHREIIQKVLEEGSEISRG